MAYFSFANNIVKGKPIRIFTARVAQSWREISRTSTTSRVVSSRVAILVPPSNTPSEKTAGKKKPKFRVFFVFFPVFLCRIS